MDDKTDLKVRDAILRYKQLLDKGKLLSYKELREDIINPMSINLFLASVDNGIFQFYSKEFIETLANDIKKLKPKTVVEVGAGDGNLSRALRRHGVNSIPTDNYSWNFTNKRRNINYPEGVERLDFKKALKKYNPDLVIICWEELGAEYTKEILKYPSVKWVLWIGEFGGCCGHPDLSELTHDYLNNPYCIARTDLGGSWHTCVVLFKKKQQTF